MGTDPLNSGGIFGVFRLFITERCCRYGLLLELHNCPQASENRDDELKIPFYVRTDLFL